MANFISVSTPQRLMTVPRVLTLITAPVKNRIIAANASVPVLKRAVVMPPKEAMRSVKIVLMIA